MIGQFVTECAATRPSEDLAESVMDFILVPKPSGAMLSDQKILLFMTILKWSHNASACS